MEELHKRWRAAAKAQAEAKRAYEETADQMRDASGATVTNEPAVELARQNLDRAIAEWQQKLEELRKAVAAPSEPGETE